MTKLLILDRDGTITQNGVRPGDYINHHTELAPIPGATERINQYFADGWRVVVASNQGGIEKGFISLEECIAGFDRTMLMFPEVEYCLFCPNAWPSLGVRAYGVAKGGINANPEFISGVNWGGFRKPEPGMLIWLRDRFSTDECLFVGDRPEDEQAAKNAGMSFLSADDWLK